MQPTQQSKQQNLIEKEEKIKAKITLKDYLNFLSYSLGIFGLILLFLICTLASMGQLAIGLFIANWAS